MFQLATVDDMEAVYELSQRAINKITPNAEVRRVWVTRNPEDSFVVKHHGKVVAFFHLIPVKHERLKEFKEGKIRGWEIGAEDIETFEPDKPVECLVIIASEQETDEITRMNYARILMRGTMQVLGDLGRRGVTITKFYATSETPTGIALSLHAGMRELDYRLGRRLAFEMDIEKADSPLLKSYKKGLAEWKREQKKPAKQRAS
jgi:hypothetical protein